MAEFTTPVTGRFCWVDLQTTDPAAAREFYSTVFGWSINDVPGPMPYAVASIGENKMTGGIMELPAMARAIGAPPNWLSYIAVDDVKASAERAVALGAATLVAPMAAGPSMFAVLQDPSGGVFAIWHSPVSMGTMVYGEDGAFGWNELMSTNVDAARAFYTGLFGWSVDIVPMIGMDYTLFKNDGAAVGGLMDMPKGADGMLSHWAVYFVVEDPDTTVELAVAHGAKVVYPLMDVPDVGRFGYLADPQGALVAVIRMEGEAS